MCGCGCVFCRHCCQCTCVLDCFALAHGDLQISSSYLTLLRGVSGASRPVLDWQNSPLHTCDPLATSKSSASADIGMYLIKLLMCARLLS